MSDVSMSSDLSKSPSSSSSLSSQAEDDRILRVAAAVAMVERGHPSGARISVRKAASIFGLPKSTLHRYIQANRGVETPRRRSGTTKRGRMSPPKKCGIPFLLSTDAYPSYR